jgi:hypothetical protein
MFRAYSAHLQQVHVVIVYMQSLLSSLCKSELSKIIVLKFFAGFIIPDGRIVFIQFYFGVFVLVYLSCSHQDFQKGSSEIGLRWVKLLL